MSICVSTEDGRLMRGTTASTRPRLSLHGYSSLGPFDRTQPDLYPIDSAWVSFSYEENKGSRRYLRRRLLRRRVLTDADKRDMGKNIWYHTFDMFKPELVSQGLMLNQPAVYPIRLGRPDRLLEQDTSLGYNFWNFTEDPIYNWLAGITTTTLYQSEIARRASQVTQDWYDAGANGTGGVQPVEAGYHPPRRSGRRHGPALEDPGRLRSCRRQPVRLLQYGLRERRWQHLPGPTGLKKVHCPANPRYVKGFCARRRSTCRATLFSLVKPVPMPHLSGRLPLQ
jgi:hypothetical protein